MVILRIVGSSIESHAAHFAQRIVIDMIGETDFLQTFGQSGLGHGFTGFVGIKGHPGVHMVIKHFLYPPNPRIV